MVDISCFGPFAAIDIPLVKGPGTSQCGEQRPAAVKRQRDAKPAWIANGNAATTDYSLLLYCCCNTGPAFLFTQ
jgi:hypothetical protein